MICANAFRFFSSQNKLTFSKGKALIMKSPQNERLFKLGNYTSIGIPALMLVRIITKYSILSTFNFFASSLVLLATARLGKHWLDFSKGSIKELFLMRSGKHIEVTHFGLGNKPVKIRISDILNPEESLSTKIKMEVFGTWVLETNKGLTFYLIQDSHAYHKDVLKDILRGVDIETNTDFDQSDIIDI